MTTSPPSGGFDAGFDLGGRPDDTAAPAAAVPAPTWRDLPAEPPYGPVPAPRTPNIRSGFAATVAETTSTFSPAQIALAVGGTLLLVAVGIGAALLLLDRGEEDVVAEASPSATAEPDAPADDPADEAAPTVAPDPPRGELQPQQPPGPGPQPELPGEAFPEAPPPDAPAPGPDSFPVPQVPDEGIDLPRLFVLRTLPSGMQETSTTVRQTTRDDEVVQEQTTLLQVERQDGAAEELTVRATRSDDVDDRLASLLEEGAEDLTVRGLPASLLPDGRLVWVAPGTVDTLIEVVPPAEVRTDQLLTIGNGLELLR